MNQSIRSFTRYVICILLPVFIILFIGPKLVQVCVVNGHSMEPTLKEGSFGILAMNPLKIDRGDIVVVKLANDELIIKRVVGVPGDHVIVENGIVLVNNEELEEDYVKYNSLLEYTDKFVGYDEYFILGDNRTDSLDSRYFGVISEDEILGKFYKVL